jgi:hypothetical protein
MCGLVASDWAQLSFIVKPAEALFESEGVRKLCTCRLATIGCNKFAAPSATNLEGLKLKVGDINRSSKSQIKCYSLKSCIENGRS